MILTIYVFCYIFLPCFWTVFTIKSYNLENRPSSCPWNRCHLGAWDPPTFWYQRLCDMPNPPIQSLISDPFLPPGPQTYTFELTHIGWGSTSAKKTLGFDLPLGDGEIGLGRNAACLPLCLCPLNRRPHRAFYKRLPVPSTLFLPLHNALNALCGRHCGAFAPFGP